MAESPWRRVLREPLLHFAVLGLGLFALFSAVGGEDPGSRRIVVANGTLENLAATFALTWQRPPTQSELEGLVADHVREEILYREAVALGLDADDVIVRRRMRQKMELLAESFGESAEPDEADLEAWLREHPDRYRSETRLGLRQVYLSRDARGADVESDAARLLETLRADSTDDPSALGDPISLVLGCHGKVVEAGASKRRERIRLQGRSELTVPIQPIDKLVDPLLTRHDTAPSSGLNLNFLDGREEHHLPCSRPPVSPRGRSSRHRPSPERPLSKTCRGKRGSSRSCAAELRTHSRLPRLHDGLRTIGDAQFGEDVRDVVANGLLAEHEALCDGRVALTLRD